MRHIKRIAAIVVGVVFVAAQANAIGRVYARIPNNQNSPIYNLRIKSLHASVVVRDQLAVTHVDQEFANDNSLRLEGFYVFQLPEGAQVNELYLWINGVRVPYTVKRREDAVVKYQEIVTQMADPAILEQLGSNTFKLRIFPFNAMQSRRIEIVYSQPLTYYRGSIQYTFPLDMRDYTSAPIEQVSISIDLASQLPIPTVQTSVDQFPTAVSVTKVDPYHWTVVYGVENVAFAKNFFVRCDVDRGIHSMLPLCYAAPDSLQEDPYMLLWTAIPDTLYGDSVTHRELTFVADVSSSMEGVRLQQVKDALGSFVDFLTDEDVFNIITFSTTTVQYSPNLVPGTGEARAAARQFVNQMVAMGLTNIEAALHQALLQTYADSSHAAIIFLTDGQPSWGEMNTDSLLARVHRWNTKGIPIFPVGVGDEPDVTLLKRLATQSNGLFMPIAAEDSIYLKMKDVYRLLFLPAVHGITMNFRSLGAYDTHPTPLPTVYTGDQILVAARFPHAGADTVTLSGTVGSYAVTLSDYVTLTDQDSVSIAISRYWGAQKITSLLRLIDSVGEKAELINQVIALSIRYSVLTPYTAFLIVEPTTGGTDVNDIASLQSLQFALLPNYPNPFNPSTTLRFTLPRQNGAPSVVRLVVYDLLGRTVKILWEGVKPPGEYSVVWDGTDGNGTPVASGVYTCVLTMGGMHDVRKLVLLR